jgi:hypothetical protein
MSTVISGPPQIPGTYASRRWVSGLALNVRLRKRQKLGSERCSTVNEARSVPGTRWWGIIESFTSPLSMMKTLGRKWYSWGERGGIDVVAQPSVAGAETSGSGVEFVAAVMMSWVCMVLWMSEVVVLVGLWLECCVMWSLERDAQGELTGKSANQRTKNRLMSEGCLV